MEKGRGRRGGGEGREKMWSVTEKREMFGWGEGGRKMMKEKVHKYNQHANYMYCKRIVSLTWTECRTQRVVTHSVLLHELDWRCTEHVTQCTCN